MSRAPGLRRKGCRQQPLWQKQPSPQARPPSLQIMQKSFTEDGHSRHAIEKWYICCVAAPAGSSSSSFRRDALRGGPEGIAEYWDVDEVRCYDAGYQPYRKLPAGQFDGVISTDVLEHCPEEDLSWILQEIFSFARRFVFLNVACFPARKTLPDGTNA